MALLFLTIVFLDFLFRGDLDLEDGEPLLALLALLPLCLCLWSQRLILHVGTLRLCFTNTPSPLCSVSALQAFSTFGLRSRPYRPYKNVCVT